MIRCKMEWWLGEESGIGCGEAPTLCFHGCDCKTTLSDPDLMDFFGQFGSWFCSSTTATISCMVATFLTMARSTSPSISDVVKPCLGFSTTTCVWPVEEDDLVLWWRLALHSNGHLDDRRAGVMVIWEVLHFWRSIFQYKLDMLWRLAMIEL